MSETVLTATDLTKTYTSGRFGRRQTVHAVRGVDFTVGKGETVAVVGESGAGKSTVGRLVLRLIEPDGGTVVFEDIDVRGLSRRDLRRVRPRMQMVFQDPFSSLDPTMTIADSIVEPLLVHGGTTAAQRQARAAELLVRVGLDPEFGERLPRELSGGQLQRVAIARAISTNPSLIVCDEPVAALDLSIRGQILNLLVGLQAETGVSYLFISHDLSVVEHFAHRVAVMYAGQVVESGPTHEVFDSPRHPYTQALLAAVPRPDFGPRDGEADSLVKGERLQEAQIGSGCAYRNRCPVAMAVCETSNPALATGDHRVACHFASEEAPGPGHGVLPPSDQRRAG
ncbi:oligopeptide/dipeptide ABC transporter ATP-binding protein [Amycolatopsis bartoniae]|uniref:Peptide ABC transporter ATP-binding protein n=1 Tax=Amycolatopsis bartoniae TaxID=941986 RepID=A0A8H9M8S0_9PSEU|nr:ABC transporter ATP-binding protein [Amycolatopsis bartoniae]MBB2939721.1 oligopeptide/dipeptide ABC transporter ATP-binding protein [Amycolatopsis bartoniae]TVT06161.1 ABC transporter ATP-binding protein [Amycolatopsis bartoniae]GHF36263.1 peptide ABC transporter ATP-binding protein [Amycolatopsis bartoniae]